MATSITTITNQSKQVVPVLVSAIPLDKASANSDLDAADARQMQLPAGSSIRVETRRLDLAQLDQLRRKGLLSYTTS